jgi:hypothetical protein
MPGLSGPDCDRISWPVNEATETGSPPSCSGNIAASSASPRNEGSGSGLGSGGRMTCSIDAPVIVTGSSAVPPTPLGSSFAVGMAAIASTTSMPSTTRPKIA